jgi:phosphoesterase RecJ-like protein
VKEAVRLVRESRRIVMSLHKQPDGDSMGSSLGVALALRRQGQDVVVASPDPVPTSYRFLPGSDTIRPWNAVDGPFDLCLLLDCADEERAGAPRPLRSYAPCIVNIDHHQTNRSYGDVNVIDPDAAASAELATALLDEMGLAVDRDIALCLYTGLSTDTGGFRYSTTSPGSHRLAARFLETGIDPGEVSEAVYEQNNPLALRVLGRALASLTLELDGRVSVMTLSRDDFSGLPPGEVDSLGIVNFGRSIAGVEVACLFREETEGIKLSLRAKGRVDVSQVAGRLGGGGHARAAGATLPPPMSSAVSTVLALLGDAFFRP